MTNFNFVKEPNSVDVYIATRIEAMIDVATNSIMVRDVAFKVLMEDGVIPPNSKVGWLSNPARRRNCSAKHNEYLDGLNRLFNAAKYHFGEDGKKSGATDADSSKCKSNMGNKARSEACERRSMSLVGVLLPAVTGSVVVDFAENTNVSRIEEYIRQNYGKRFEIVFNEIE